MDYAAVSEAIKRMKIKKKENHHLATSLKKVVQILNI
jgi:hypothetical protein